MIDEVEYRVRRATPEDWNDIVDLDGSIEGDEIYYSKNGERWWVAERSFSKVVVGYAGYYPFPPENAVVLHRAGVDPLHRRRGLHRRLLKARIRQARLDGYVEAYTHTHHANIQSSNNLINAGFRLWWPAHWGGYRPHCAYLYWFLGLDNDRAHTLAQKR